MMLRDALIQEIDLFCAAAAVAVSSFGEMAVSDRTFVSRLKKGGDIKLGTADRIRRHMAANWPPAAPMPDSLRPYLPPADPAPDQIEAAE